MSTTWGYLINKNIEERILELQSRNNVICYQGTRLFQIDYNNFGKKLIVLSYPCWLNGCRVNQKQYLENEAIITTDMGMEKISYTFVERNSSGNEFLQKMNLNEEHIFGTKIGKGGFGTVYSIFEKASGVKSALKIQTLKIGDVKPTREAQVLPQLHHSCLIGTDWIKFLDSTMIIKMEYMQGGDLQQFVNTSGPHLSELQTKVIFYQIAEAVDYLHGKGICHRDLKPENILLQNKSPHTLIKVSDFGLAKSEIIHSPMISCCGTNRFIAPEVCNWQGRRYDKTIDVWSMGVILYLSLSGKFPVFKENTSSLKWHKNVLSLENNFLFALLQGMLQKEPEYRFDVSDVREQKWLKDKYVEDKVLELKASDTSTKVRKQRTHRRVSSVTQTLQMQNTHDASGVLLAGVGMVGILGICAFVVSELFKPNHNN